MDKNSTVLIHEPTKKTGNICELVFGSSLTIKDIASHTKKISQSLENHNDFRVITNEPISNIDLGGLQSLLFIEKYCNEQGKQVQFNIQVTEETQELFHHTGFDYLVESK